MRWLGSGQQQVLVVEDRVALGVCFFFCSRNCVRAWDVPVETPSGLLSSCPFLAVVISIG